LAHNKLQMDIERNLQKDDKAFVRQNTDKAQNTPSVYDSYMRALSRKKTNQEMITILKTNQDFNYQVKEII